MLKYQLYDDNLMPSAPPTPCVFLLGGFDGLHIGHKKLLDFAENGLKQPIALMTIEGGKGDVLFTTREREKIFAAAGVEYLLTIPFTDSLKNMSAEQFIHIIEEKFSVAAYVCGEDFRFGKNAVGTPQLISDVTGKRVYALDIFNVGGQKVSTSTVKQLLSQGDIKRANNLLTTPFFITGVVEEGRKLGRKLGFPTANVTYPKEKFSLKEGVYAVHATLHGKVYKGICNVGACPTFNVEYRKVEPHFDGFHGDIYGEEIDVFFDEYLRDIQNFGSAEALIAQLNKDIEVVRNS